jgi:tetratricopeptide (TPR) repeat protein
MERLGRIDMLIELLRNDTEDVFLNYALGLEYSSDLGTVNEAEQQYKKVLQLNKDYIAAYYQMGKLFESQLKNEQALRYFKDGLAVAKKLNDSKAVNEFEEAIFLLED